MGLSLAQLAKAVGIGPTSVSLIAAMEHGTIPPRRDVAERLAAVLELEREPLLMWSDTRMTPRTSDEALRERVELETRFTQLEAFRRRAYRSSGSPADIAGPSGSPWAFALEQAPDRIPILPAGADPDTHRRKPLGYLDRPAMERLIGNRANLVGPVAYKLSDDDFERLRRVAHPFGRPLHALVSRSLPIEIDPREPFAIRFDGRVILAYCAWDDRELIVIQARNDAGFVRLKAKTQSELERHVVGQVVALNWWEPTDSE